MNEHNTSHIEQRPIAVVGRTLARHSGCGQDRQLDTAVVGKLVS